MTSLSLAAACFGLLATVTVLFFVSLCLCVIVLWVFLCCQTLEIKVTFFWSRNSSAYEESVEFLKQLLVLFANRL